MVGGHTIEDEEPKYGMAVFGTAHPDEIVRNVGARPGDALVLTKPIGTGIMTTALKRGLETEESVRPSSTSMAHLNRLPPRPWSRSGVNAATDVTGFGLLGHLHEMLAGSGVEATVAPPMTCRSGRARSAMRPTSCAPGARRTSWRSSSRTRTGRDTPVEWRSLLADSQTSGGLLMSLPSAEVGRLIAALAARGETGVLIGDVSQGEAGMVRVR